MLHSKTCHIWCTFTKLFFRHKPSMKREVVIVEQLFKSFKKDELISYSKYEQDISKIKKDKPVYSDDEYQ